MPYVLSIGIDLIAALMVLLPILCLFLFFFQPRDFRRTALFTLFVLYLCAVFSVVGLPSIHALTFDPSINWLPLLDGVHDPLGYLKNTVLNVLLFLPLGFLLPVVWTEERSLKRVLAWGFGLSLGIELLQLFSLRLTDVDDLITNTLGAALGYFLCRPVFSSRPPLSTSAGTSGRWTPMILVLVAFLVMFTAQPLIADALWELVLESSLWEQIR